MNLRLVVRLAVSIKLLQAHRSDMAIKYGDPKLKDFDTCKYLDGIRAAMNAADTLKAGELSHARWVLSKLATPEEIEFALEITAEENDK